MWVLILATNANYLLRSTLKRIRAWVAQLYLGIASLGNEVYLCHLSHDHQMYLKYSFQTARVHRHNMA